MGDLLAWRPLDWWLWALRSGDVDGSAFATNRRRLRAPASRSELFASAIFGSAAAAIWSAPSAPSAPLCSRCVALGALRCVALHSCVASAWSHVLVGCVLLTG